MLIRMPDVVATDDFPWKIGRYAIFGKIAEGGMALVHLGRQLGDAGFARTVAVKRMRREFSQNPGFASMFADEARIASRIEHPSIVRTLDAISTGDELLLVMEYVAGEPLSHLIEAMHQREAVAPPPIAAAILTSALYGLHAAHQARNERGEPLDVVHRDVSPHNIMVGREGVARVLDFGIARGAGRMQVTADGAIKGKISYMAPEQLRGAATRQSDVYSAAVVLWELLTTRRLFRASTREEIVERVLHGRIEPPSAYAAGVPPALDEVTLRGLARDPAARFRDCMEMARAIEQATPVASPAVVGQWVEVLAHERLSARAARVKKIEEYRLDTPAPAAPALLESPQSASAPAAIRATTGARIGRYELLLELAHGGMGSVWAARASGSHGFERLVAMKMILPSLAVDARFRHMFLDEARLTGAIQHPNVAQMIDLGDEAGLLYQVMEWIDGAPLNHLFRVCEQRGEHLPVGVALRFIADVCSGLHAAHELCDASGAPLQIVHRDVSPQNILVTEAGAAKLIDFGIAKARARLSEDTSTGSFRGKLRYAPPEQALGKPLDRRADVWALGAVLRLALGGGFSYEGDEVQILGALLRGDAPRPMPAVVPANLASIVSRAMAIRPEERFPSASAFGEALEAAMRALRVETSAAQAGIFVRERLGSLIAERRARLSEARQASGLRAPAPWSNSAPVRAAVRVTNFAVAAEPDTRLDASVQTPTPHVKPSRMRRGARIAATVGALALSVTVLATRARVSHPPAEASPRALAVESAPWPIPAPSAAHAAIPPGPSTAPPSATVATAEHAPRELPASPGPRRSPRLVPQDAARGDGGAPRRRVPLPELLDERQ
jgi:serine/threonine-protein kinase